MQKQRIRAWLFATLVMGWAMILASLILPRFLTPVRADQAAPHQKSLQKEDTDEAPSVPPAKESTSKKPAPKLVLPPIPRDQEPSKTRPAIPPKPPVKKSIESPLPKDESHETSPKPRLTTSVRDKAILPIKPEGSVDSVWTPQVADFTPPPCPVGPISGKPLPQQTKADEMAKSIGCLHCHKGIEPMHASKNVVLGCTDCHGGDATALTKEQAHVHPRFAHRWPTSANPQRTFALLNQESPDFVRFINPGDFRAAVQSCGVTGCHPKEVATNRKSIMGHSAMVPGSALYNNGAVPNKIYRWGEVYGEDGKPQRAYSWPRPTEEDVIKRGILPWIDPLPRFEITQPDFNFRILEKNNVATSLRGPGTDFRADAVFLNLVKTKLNDPTMVFLGSNDHPGDYRSSGCTSCHVLYANDRDPLHSAHVAHFGNTGLSASDDPTIPKNESGHPIKHQFTRAIPSSQCMTCHFHQGSGALGNYYGFAWWDYETDADQIYKRYGMPRGGGVVGNIENPAMRQLAVEVNPHLYGNEFADFHNASWLFQAVYKRDRKGNLLDENNTVIPEQDPDWHKKVVHLADIHLKRGMHCVDCHFYQDVHGDGNLYGAMIDAVEIACKDCHGTVSDRANFVTSNPAGGNNIKNTFTPFGKRRFYEKAAGRVFQRSAVTENLEWEVKQIKDVVTPGHPNYRPAAQYAKTMQKDGVTWGYVPSKDNNCKLAHDENKVTCYACHSSWNTSCGGCHLSASTNVKAEVLHYEGGFSKVYASYNPQAIRSDTYLLGIGGTVQGNKVTPVRAASGVVVSAADGNRATVVHQHPTFAAEGHSGHAFSPNPPHTVGGPNETKRCTDCHISAAGDNNAVVAQVLGLGVRSYDFLGRYAYIATGTKGIEAVQITVSDDFPNPVIGSNFHRIVDPKGYERHHQEFGGKLRVAHRHDSKNAQSLVHVGEWVLVADGPGGLRVFDTANIHNKDVAQKIVSSPLAPWIGQRQDVKTAHASWVAIASTVPVDPSRERRPENEEQPIHTLFQYAYVTDLFEGLIIVDILTLLDGKPENNFIKRTVTFNPDGILTGAVRVKIHGEHAYVLTKKNGMVVVNISDPKCPKIVTVLGEPDLKEPRAIDFQFRYAFVCDREGLKVVDVTHPETPRVVASTTIADARDVWVMKTFAYVAAGKDGLGIVDVERITEPKLTFYHADSCINDATAVVTGVEHNSFFAFLADGANGLRVIQLLSPADGHQIKGFSPDPKPRLIATYPTRGPCLAISEGLPRDRYVDIDGNQIGVFGRRGSRPFNREEMRRLYMRDGEVFTVSDLPPTPETIGENPATATKPQKNPVK